MSKTIILVIIAIVIIAGLGYWFLRTTETDEVLSEKEQACLNSGGVLSTALCCESTDDFPDTCLIGACGCSPTNSREIKICDCGEGCFDGKECTKFVQEAPLGPDPLNSTYIINREMITLENGYSEKDIVPGAVSRMKTQVFASSTGDINGDEIEDTVLVLVNSSGGSGTFYYVAAAVKVDEEYKGTNTVLLGDRIVPQVISVENGIILSNYVDRFPWESFAEEPSVAKIKRLVYENGELKEMPSEVLSQETAEELISDNWGDCSAIDCETLAVSVLDGKDGVWYLSAVYDGLKDDSVRVQKKIVSVNYEDEIWKLGNVLLTEYICQPDRGQQNFSDEFCL